jgi:hypothetical protein
MGTCFIGGGHSDFEIYISSQLRDSAGFTPNLSPLPLMAVPHQNRISGYHTAILAIALIFQENKLSKIIG